MSARCVESGAQSECHLGQIAQQLESLVANPLQLVTTLLTNPNTNEKCEDVDNIDANNERKYFEMVADSTPVLLWMTGTDMNSCFFNKSWLNFTGNTLEEELSNGWIGSVHPADIKMAMNIFTTAFVQRKEFRLEYRLRRYDGQYRWLLDTGTPLIKRGEFVGYVGTCLDITEVKESRAKLAAFNRQQNALVILGQLALNYLNRTVFGNGSEGRDRACSVGPIVDEQAGLTSLMTKASKTIAAAFHADRISILEFRHGSSAAPDQLVFRAGYGWDEETLSILNDAPCRLTSHNLSSSPFGEDTLDFKLDTANIYRYFNQFNIYTPFIEVIHGAGHKPYGVLCLHHVSNYDVTIDECNTLRCISHILSCAIAQERAYRELNQSEQLTRSVINSANSGIFTVDCLGNIVSLNPAACASFGFDEQTPPVGLPIWYLIPSFTSASSQVGTSVSVQNMEINNPPSCATATTTEQNSSRTASTVEQLLHTPGCSSPPFMFPQVVPQTFTELMQQYTKASVETTGVKKTGGTFPLKVTVNEVSVHNQRLFTIFTKDMTSTKQLEKEAANSAAKSLYLSRMSHELRTPLNSLLNMADVLLETNPLSTEQMDIVESIITAGNNLRTLIDDVLDLSKIEAGKMDLCKEPFGIRECVEHSIDLLALAAQNKNIELLLFVDDDIPGLVVGDAARLRQVLVNIISNAIKFTDEGYVSIRISLLPTPGVALENPGTGNECTLLFEIKDTGIGIERDKIDKLFTDFTQAHTTQRARYGGSGLGLAICKKIVELMKGSVNISSVIGQGTTVTFTTRVPVHLATIPKPLAASPDRKKLRALVVDKNKWLREVFSHLCDSLSLECISVDSPASALDLIRKGETFDVGIVEYHSKWESALCGCMRGGGSIENCGVEFTKSVREMTVTFPVVLITPVTFSKSLLGENAQLFAGFLTKPVKTASFQLTIQRVLANINGTSEQMALSLNGPAQRKNSGFDKTLSLSIPLSILVAEDNLANQKVVNMLFSRMGYTIDIAANGLEALDALHKKHYDVVFMDIEMPDMDGLECSRIICTKYSEDIRPVIVAQTAHVLREDIDNCYKAGMKYCLIKPLKIDKIAEILKAVGAMKFVSHSMGGGINPAVAENLGDSA